MLTLLFVGLMIVIFGKLFWFLLKATCGLGLIVLMIVFLPGVLTVMAAFGLMAIALPILLVIGAVTLIGSAVGFLN